MSGDAGERSRSLGDRLHVALSDVRARNGRVRRRLGRAFDASLLGVGIHGLDRALEHSRLAAWFRRSPEGPVSVDLAESSVAGPLAGLVGPPLRYVVTAWHESTAAGALGPVRQSAGRNSAGAVRSITWGSARVASALALVVLLAVVSVRGPPADPIAFAPMVVLAGAALLGLIAGPRASLRTSAVGRVLRWLCGDAPEASDRSR